MTAAKKTTTTRKTATRKPVVKRSVKKTTERQPRQRRQRREVAPMTEAVRRAGAAAISKFEEMMMDQEGTGFLSASTPQVKGPMSDSKLVKRVKVELEDGSRHTAVVQVTFR